MIIEVLNYNFCICKIDGTSQIDIHRDFFFLAKTDGEVSLVCKDIDAPKDSAAIDRGWRGLRIAGTLDFSLVGILADISSVLAKAGVPIFAVSTYNTDYIFIKEQSLVKAVTALKDSGYNIK